MVAYDAPIRDMIFAMKSVGGFDRIAALPPGADGQPPLVTLRADKALDYGAVVAVMGDLNRAGITRISLVTGGAVAKPASAGSANGG